MFTTFDDLWAHMGETMTDEDLESMTDDDVDELANQLGDNIAEQLKLFAEFEMSETMSELIAANVYDAEDRVYYCEKYGLPLTAEDDAWAGADADDYRADVNHSYEMGIAYGLSY